MMNWIQICIKEIELSKLRANEIRDSITELWLIFDQLGIEAASAWEWLLVLEDKFNRFDAEI